MNNIEFNVFCDLDWLKPWIGSSQMPTTKDLFIYKGVKLNFVGENDQIDLIFWDFVNKNNIDEESQKIHTTDEIRRHPCYIPSLNNPNALKIFDNGHEILPKEEYEAFIELFSKELKCHKSKIILIDTIVVNRKDTIEVPLLLKLKLFNYFRDSLDIMDRTKKFSCLANKPNSLRVRIFDKLIEQYEGDFEKLKNENFISFRNVQLVPQNNPGDFSILDGVPSLDLTCFYHESHFLKYPYSFYRNIGLPWLLDDIDCNKHHDMYEKVTKIYSSSFFSLISETDSDFETLSNDYQKFSEKVIIPFICGNLPFVIVDYKYYQVFEEAGFDFSYLKDVFDIDYKTNSPEQNLKSIPKFIQPLCSKSIEEVENLYESLQPIVLHNQKLSNNIRENNEPTENEWKFLNELKKRKF